AVRRGEAFDGDHLGPVSLDRQHEARADGVAIDHNSARAADAVLAPKMRPRQAELVAQKVRQCCAAVHLLAYPMTVDGHFYMQCLARRCCLAGGHARSALLTSAGAGPRRGFFERAPSQDRGHMAAVSGGRLHVGCWVDLFTECLRRTGDDVWRESLAAQRG